MDSPKLSTAKYMLTDGFPKKLDLSDLKPDKTRRNPYQKRKFFLAAG
ncbi:hypothetical protein LEP1GSC060_2576 [Leptospira weilii serovar Ranarum str. ICFT]|uniref:Uncharacterized protein n=1 Tax=Leptospira weilii serovar Ranarum str. ICFT TaxID=1218598 RepID=N1WPV4_9LEPT|nr:hypothetical protein LEP1GSC060_2576 [Leptospira weilii serovar Ranarum str. ICFT]